MNIKKDGLSLATISAGFLLFYFLPVNDISSNNFIMEALLLAKWYAREHVILCLIPAFFIAGAISIFISQNAVIKYLGSRAKKVTAYAVASLSGGILAVCSCTILPLFAGIYRMGAGIGPASAFLYAGPAVNILAIILTARILGLELGIARLIGAVVFSIVIGLFMQLIFAKDNRAENRVEIPDDDSTWPLWKNVIYFGLMIGILIFANWSGHGGWLSSIKWYLTSACAVLLLVVLRLWFKIGWIKIIVPAVITGVAAIFFGQHPKIPFAVGAFSLAVILYIEPGEGKSWLDSSWLLARQILPLLLAGILIAGALLGRPDGQGLIPAGWISNLVGGNSLMANLFASVIGAFMYFATLTEIPILQGLIANGMGKGPALALLLAGPALSLPNMLVIRSIMGTKKTAVFILLVIIMATISGLIFGILF